MSENMKMKQISGMYKKEINAAKKVIFFFKFYLFIYFLIEQEKSDRG